jgi:hypothetical protein
MAHTSFTTIKRQLAYQEAQDVMDTITREKIELAEFLETETQMDFDEAMAVIEEQCTELLPGCRGIEKLMVFRNEIRDPLKDAARREEDE